jgi:hypothetical protein
MASDDHAIRGDERDRHDGAVSGPATLLLTSDVICENGNQLLRRQPSQSSFPRCALTALVQLLARQAAAEAMAGISASPADRER